MVQEYMGCTDTDADRFVRSIYGFTDFGLQG